MEATELDNKTNYLEKNNTNVDSITEDHNEFIKKHKLILQTQYRFKSDRYNIFTQEINKVVLSSIYDKKCNQSIQ